MQKQDNMVPDFLDKIKKSIDRVGENAKAQYNKAYSDIAMRVYLIYQDELKASGNPYEINEPTQKKDGSWVITPKDPKLAFEVEFGKPEQGTSLTEKAPDQIMRRVSRKAEQILNQYRKAGIEGQIKYKIDNPTF